MYIYISFVYIYLELIEWSPPPRAHEWKQRKKREKKGNTAAAFGSRKKDAIAEFRVFPKRMLRFELR